MTMQTPTNAGSCCGCTVDGTTITGDGSPGNPFEVAQGLISQKNVTWWQPQGPGTAVLSMIGLQATATGTPTNRGLATTNLATSVRRQGNVSAAVAASVAAQRATAAAIWRGNAAGLGGFWLRFRFFVSDAVLVPTANMFAGVNASIAAPTDVNPATLANIIGVGCSSGDTNLQLYAAGAVAQAKLSLGPSFPVNTVNTDVYELILSALANGSSVAYQVTRLNTGDKVSGTISAAAQLPSNTTFLAQQIWRSNGGAASAVGFDLINHYCEQPV